MHVYERKGAVVLAVESGHPGCPIVIIIVVLAFSHAWYAWQTAAISSGEFLARYNVGKCKQVYNHNMVRYQ